METTAWDAQDLMMEALDGTLDADGWAALRRQPEQQAAFEQLARIDAALRATPPAAVPPLLTRRLMGAVAAAEARKSLNAAQAAFLVAAGSLVMMGGGLAAAAAVSLIALAAPPDAWQAGVALGAQILAFARQVSEIAGVLLRAIFSQPVMWALVAAVWIVAGAWGSATALAWSRRPARPGNGLSALS